MRQIVQCQITVISDGIHVFDNFLAFIVWFCLLPAEYLPLILFHWHIFVIADTEKRLRRDLRRTKALLRDAELVMQKQKSSEGSRVTVRQLKSQVGF